MKCFPSNLSLKKERMYCLHSNVSNLGFLNFPFFVMTPLRTRKITCLTIWLKGKREIEMKTKLGLYAFF